ncbi:phenoloxidase-activating factor 2 [Anabrus simplex]|uniref:phenoloxidase-activating factor 2 n=1 Tax=Anabrus simplex TaxID=316456 RepID=UPI0035A3BF60
MHRCGRIMSQQLIVCYVSVILVTFASAQNSSFSDESTWDTCVCSDGPCSCVVYYLCGLDGVIISTGDNVLDPRFGGRPTVDVCSGIQVCCKEPPDTDSGSSPDLNPSTPRLPPLQPDRNGCGLRDTSFNLDAGWSRINIDDGTTAFAEFPWMLALLRRDRGINVFECGASLIHYKVALTAAHCVQKILAEDLIVRAGEWNTTSFDEPIGHQDRGVSRIILHPNFTKGSLFNDMALLELESPFQEAINVGIVCLPEPGALFDRQRCLATGWGRDAFGREGKVQTTLRKVDLPIVESSTCQSSLRTTRLGIFFRLNKSFICAGGEGEKDTCKGDGGGPLMCQSMKDPLRYIQAGIVSWGIGCKDSQIPAVYTNVAFLRNWIDSQLASMKLENLAIHP